MRIYKLLFYFYFIFISMAWSMRILLASNCPVNNYKSVLGIQHYPQNFKHLTYAKAKAKKGGVLKLVTYNTFNSFAPFGLGILPQDYYRLSYDSLFSIPLDDVNTYYPLLAQAYCLNKNKLYLQLSPQAQWSDGVPLNAEDIVFTFKSLKAMAYPSYFDALKTIETFQISHNRQRLIMIQSKNKTFSPVQLQILFSIPIIPKHYWQNKNLLENQLQIPPFSGGYGIEKFDTNGKFIVFKRNKHYWGANLPIRKGHYNFDKIQYTYANSKQNAYKLFPDKVNFIAFKQIDLSLISKLKTSHAQKILIKKVPIAYIPPFKALFFNTQQLNLQNIKVRQALALAYDFSSINQYIFNNQQKRFTSLFTNSPFASSFTSEFNLQKADKLLNEAGFVVKNKLRVSKAGALKLVIIFNNKAELEHNLIFLNNLNRLSIQVSAKIVAKSQYPKLLKQGLYDIILAEYLFSNPPQRELKQYFSMTKRNNFYNYSQLKDDSVDELLTKIIHHANNLNYLKQLDKYLFKQYLFIPLSYYPNNTYMYLDIFSSYRLTAFGIDIFTWSIK